MLAGPLVARRWPGSWPYPLSDRWPDPRRPGRLAPARTGPAILDRRPRRVPALPGPSPPRPSPGRRQSSPPGPLQPYPAHLKPAHRGPRKAAGAPAAPPAVPYRPALARLRWSPCAVLDGPGLPSPYYPRQSRPWPSMVARWADPYRPSTLRARIRCQDCRRRGPPLPGLEMAPRPIAALGYRPPPHSPKPGLSTT